MAKTVGIGIQSFEEVIEGNYFYIDKTSFIKEWWESGDSVTLITRPRRFGKTMLIDMFASFLKISQDERYNIENRKKLFDGLEITKDPEFIDKYMAQFPVISLSLKKVYGMTFEEAYDALARVVVNLFSAFKSKIICLDCFCTYSL